jgi:large subunit ribosomal protein L10
MENPRPEKVAVVEEVRERLASASAAIVTEYRGLTVAELADLRRSLAAAGSDYKVYKNTLVRLAIAGSDHQTLEDLLTGPTAIAFVSGDVSAVAKALREFSRNAPSLVIKGGLLDGGVLSASQLVAMADLPPRQVLLARLAGGMAAPLTQMAGLLEALPRNLAYGLAALLSERKAAEPEMSGPVAEEEAEPGAPEAPAAGEPGAQVPQTPTVEAPEDGTAEAPEDGTAAPQGAAEATDAETTEL